MWSLLSYSEGTYELNNRDASNPNVYIESMPAGNSVGAIEAGLRRITVFNVDVLNANELIDIYTSANAGSVDVAIWCENNAPTTNFSNDHQYAKKTYNISQNNTGHISSWSDVVNAQSLATRNKTPITFDPSSEGCGTGVYSIRIYGTGNGSTNDAVEFVDIRVRESVSTTINNTNLNGFWGWYCPLINYQNSSCTTTTIDQNLKLGRVWSYHYSLILGTFDREMNSKYYVVAGKAVLDYYSGYLWEVINNGIQPHGVHVTANSLGAYPQINHNKSVPNSANPIMVPEYPIYLNPPEKNVLDPLISPEVTNMQFSANCSNTTPQGGTFSFDTTDEWNYAFYIDVNNDGSFFENEAIIRGKTVNGENLITWDGKFENGQDVPSDRGLVLSLNLAAGEIHFPYYDVENRFTRTGPTIKLYNSVESNRSKKYFWDDSEIGGDSSNYLGSLIPHQWDNDLGNEAIIDTWKNAINTVYDLEFVYGQACLSQTKIKAKIFQDDNHNGRFNSSENLGSFNTKLNIYNNDNQTCEKVSFDQNGYFEQLVDYGNYTLTLNPNNSVCSTNIDSPSGYIPTTEMKHEFDLNGIAAVKLFGLFHGKTVEGEVLVDNGTSGGTQSTGIANNGNREQYEQGLTGVVIKAVSNGSLIDTSYTDTQGFFKLWVPSSYGSITVEYNKPYGYISVNSNIGNSSSISYSYDDILINMSAIQNVSGLVFSVVKVSRLDGEGTVYGQAGSAVYLNNELKTHSYTINKYEVKNKTEKESPWNVILYHDDECNGTIENWNTIIQEGVDNTTHDYNNINNSCVLSKVFLPLGANEGEDFSYDVCANVTFHNTVITEDLCYRNKVLVIKNSANIELIKEADKIIAKPGEEILYTIIIKNNGLKNALDLKIFDSTPPYTSFVEASCQNNSGSNISNCIYITNMMNLKGDIEWNLTGSLAPSEEYRIYYKVKIND